MQTETFETVVFFSVILALGIVSFGVHLWTMRRMKASSAQQENRELSAAE